MGKTLAEIAQQLQANNKKVQLIYAFNGTGKTRLSREFKNLIAPKQTAEDGLVEEVGHSEISQKNILYYSAFTEDLFYWDNDLAEDAQPKFKIHLNSFTNWILGEQGQDQNIIGHFQHYTNRNLTPKFNADFSEVTFAFTRGDDTPEDHIKISKGEESNFIWSIFYSLIEQVTGVLNTPEVSERETDQFNGMEYIFIDDPVSSLDENHLIELAVNLAQLINKSESDIKFIITTHNALFYNVLYNELNLKKKKGGYFLKRHEDNTFELEEKNGDSNKSFSYHLHLKGIIEEAISQEKVERYHFMLLRNLYEKTANFLGYSGWSQLLPDEGRQGYFNRIINFTSHSTLSNETIAEPTEPEKATIAFLLEHLVNHYNFWKDENQDESGN